MPISLPPDVRTLILKYNRFSSVDASINFYSSLELVDLSHNGLVSIPARSFKSQRALLDLRLNHNKISDLTGHTFTGLASLTSLQLRHNLLTTICQDCLAELASLQELRLSANRISAIHPEAFKTLTRLRVLTLDDNNLDAVPEALSALTSLTHLNLAGNSIQVISDAALPLPSLSSLNLANNGLQRLHERGLETVSQLRLLNLEGNSLYEVPSAALAPLHSLETLSLGGNLFSVIPRGALTGLDQLARLDVSGCPSLSLVEEGAFSSNPGLKELIMANNSKLEVIEAGAFKGVTGLEVVDLSNNGLRDLASSLMPWAGLVNLQVSGNPLHCDCSTIFLQEVIYSTVNSSSDSAMRVVRCWTPLELRDQDLALLQLQCDVTSSSRSAGSPDMVTMAVVAAVVAVLVVVCVLVVVVRLRRIRSGVSRLPVHHKDILHYDDPPEPRYVVNTYNYKTGAVEAHTNLKTNPFQEKGRQAEVGRLSGKNPGGSLFRNQDYFDSLARLDLCAAASRGTDQQLKQDQLIYTDPDSVDPVHSDDHTQTIYMDPNSTLYTTDSSSTMYTTGPIISAVNPTDGNSLGYPTDHPNCLVLPTGRDPHPTFAFVDSSRSAYTEPSKNILMYSDTSESLYNTANYVISHNFLFKDPISNI